MEDWANFAWTVVASSAGTTTLLAGAAWLFKGQISHWLSKDLEALKAGHQRDLESYKVGLIAAAERAKAFQEVKTARALRMVDKQIAALDRLHIATLGHAARASTFMRMRRSLGDSALGPVNVAVTELIEAVRLAGVFLTPDEIVVFHELQMTFGHAIETTYKTTEPLPEQEILLLELPLFTAQGRALQIINKHVAAMFDMS